MGAREDALKKLINIYKYNSVRACSFVLADLLNALGDYGKMCVVPLPTIERHVRERGFDHIDLLVKNFVRLNACRWSRVLVRGNKAVQVGASEEKRVEQAKTAYIAKDNIDREVDYLLVDDVWTTGSSMLAACNALQKVGCKNINVAVIAKSG